MRNSQPNGRRPPTAGAPRNPVPGPAKEPAPAVEPGASAGPAGEPAFRVVAGHPSPAELAALTAALSAKLAASAAAAAAAARNRPAVSAWSDRARLLGVRPAPGADAWRRSAWPG
jgi:hypothetical protein